MASWVPSCQQAAFCESRTKPSLQPQQLPQCIPLWLHSDWSMDGYKCKCLLWGHSSFLCPVPSLLLSSLLSCLVLVDFYNSTSHIQFQSYTNRQSCMFCDRFHSLTFSYSCGVTKKRGQCSTRAVLFGITHSNKHTGILNKLHIPKD